jgi:DNA polymerase III sliding clamp (beta) subunit (PCNA family)
MESVPAGFAGADRVISFNPHYLLDGLAAAGLTGQGQHAASGDDGSAAPARIRLQFTSPAKPALITWLAGDASAGASEADHYAADDVPGPGDAELEHSAEFRYLVVPLRTPAAG